MKIALAHFRVGETDGVSLEMEKWKLAFEKMGHEVVFLAGSEGQTEAYVIDELHYMHPLNNKFVYNAYERLMDYDDEQAFEADMLQFAASIEQKLVTFITNEKIDVLIPNNILSLGWGLPASIAFYNAAKKTNVKYLCHHHDFFWERDKYSNPTCAFIEEWLKTYFPPLLGNVNHVVINKIAQNELESRRGISSTVVPNVFDFDGNQWQADEYNKDMREAIGLQEDDIVILQATRITERKAIELGVDVVSDIQKQIKAMSGKTLYNGKIITPDTKIVYVLPGLPESSPRYLELLNKKAKELGVDIRYVNDRVDHSRYLNNQQKVYSLWDAYVIADLITYPSILEGWGNQLLEGVFAKKPVVIYEYPVYQTDIADIGFTFTSLGGNYTLSPEGLVEVPVHLVDQAGKEAANVLTDASLYKQITEHNFALGKKHYSYEALEEYLANVLKPLYA
ncbi:glycosyltransferase [Fredinandcohnia sp. 179-A 10B2 NHS]|uniref:glycosyltransferase n=1 Tax=Fredinandcohnia sp. 179-A 10B2 NHS TaxID=3235176 RepID=UPI0039A12770